MFDVSDTTVSNILTSMGMSNLSMAIFLFLLAVIVVIAGVRTVAVVTRESRRLRQATLKALEDNAMISNAITGNND